jgi:DNA invertase Pin-like site-specific DNA recombinase
MNVIAYVRVSTQDQADHGISLEAQAARLAAYADLYGLEVIETIVDAGESAKSLNRPGLQRALAMLKRGEADGLAVIKLDRLTRNVGDWQVLIDDHFGERAGRQLFSVNDAIDTRSASGRLVLNVLLSVAQWEREATGERTRDALRHKIKSGQRCGRLRYGYDLAPDGKNLIPNELEQQTIATMHELRTNGHTLRRIAEALTARGIPTKQRRSAWSSAAVARILDTRRLQVVA